MTTEYKIFKTTEEADAWVEKYKSIFPTDSDTDKLFLKAIEYYTASGFPLFNNHLRDHKHLEEDNYFYPYIAKMVEVLPKYHIPEDIIVYRYINKGLLKEMCKSCPLKRGSVIQDKGFMSTTLIRESVCQLRRDKKLNVLLLISIPKGTKGTYVDLLNDSLPEYEIILAPNTRLRVDCKFPFFNNYFECTVID